MILEARIKKGISYTKKLKIVLPKVEEKLLNINTCPSACMVTNGNNLCYSLSKWVSPKRTRSYPYERIYNTLQFMGKRITIIPVVKDEGLRGDRDFIQWDTISLMSLLDVYVILGYYDKASKNPRNPAKITKQEFNNKYIRSKIQKLRNYHSSALHWNLNEIKSSLANVTDSVKKSYKRISKQLGIEMHSEAGIDKFKKDLKIDVNDFMLMSRKKAKFAQGREYHTLQPKERLAINSKKAQLTILNYLGGEYNLTVDEVCIKSNKLYLQENKHTNMGIIPSIGDIKDGLLKMMIFTSLEDLTVKLKTKSKGVDFIPTLKLTSPLLKGKINSNSKNQKIVYFLKVNKINSKLQSLIESIFLEARSNKFVIEIANTL